MKRLALAAFALVALAASAGAQVIPPGTNPVPVGGAYNSSPPTCVSGSACWFQVDVNGNLKTTGSATLSGTTSNASSGVATSATNVPTVSYNYGFNGTTWDQLQVDVNKNLKTVVGPSAATTSGLTPVSSSALAANTVIKASAGNLYSFEVSADSTLSAAAWWIMIYNATSAPADGAVTPLKCYAISSGTTSYAAAFMVPVSFSTGATIGVSTTGCFTKTASTHAFISGDAQ